MNNREPASEKSLSSFIDKFIRILKKIFRQITKITQIIINWLKKLFRKIGAWLKAFGNLLKRGWRKFMQHFAKWIDPKLAKYRNGSSSKINLHQTSSYKLKSVSTKSAQTKRVISKAATIDSNSPNFSEKTFSEPTEPTLLEITGPTSRDELFALIKDTPISVLTNRERKIITNLLELPVTLVSEIMIQESKIVYVKHDELLGPLTLDRLYQSGFSHFPVINSSKQIIGVINTTHLNNLEIRDSVRADEILDPGVYFIREDYTLEQTLNAFLRTSTQLFFVVDHYGKIVGLLPFQNFIRFIFGPAASQDHFDRDNDRLAVAKRKDQK